MGKNLTKRDEDYSKWYNELVVKADLAENSAVRGCMVIKPYGYAIGDGTIGDGITGDGITGDGITGDGMVVFTILTFMVTTVGITTDSAETIPMVVEQQTILTDEEMMIISLEIEQLLTGEILITTFKIQT